LQYRLIIEVKKTILVLLGIFSLILQYVTVADPRSNEPAYCDPGFSRFALTSWRAPEAEKLAPSLDLPCLSPKARLAARQVTVEEADAVKFAKRGYPSECGRHKI